jgi:hypothetical protein
MKSYQKWACLALAAATWLLLGSASEAQESALSSGLAGLALTANSIDFRAEHSTETSVIRTPSAGGPGSGGLDAGQHPDPEPPSGLYGLSWTLQAQIDNSAGTSAVTVPQGNLHVAGMPANWHALIKPVSVAYTVPAHSTGQMMISGLHVAQGMPSMPSYFGVGQITLAAGQTARMQLTLLGVLMPVRIGLNPSFMLDFGNEGIGGLVE